MKRRNILTVVVTTVAIAFMVVPAQATLMSYEFAVTATSGPLAGTAADGTFAFDDSIIPSGGGLVNNGITDLNFTWHGIAYNETNLALNLLDFDATGNLDAEFFGTFPCGAPIPPGFIGESWCINNTSSNHFFIYFVAGVEGSSLGPVSVQPVSAAVPEPATILLLGSGLIGFMVFGRSRFLKK